MHRIMSKIKKVKTGKETKWNILSLLEKLNYACRCSVKIKITPYRD